MKMERILIRDESGRIVAFIDQLKNGHYGYAFGKPRTSYIMFEVESLELAKARVFEII